ncbi:hypothetical protein SNE35_18705 [Paucibacter sp. R3-3]|uniref:Uncharacterized protein n=1 Tax=Roseateles agri TaxID=3098619 RepID=A0ABU5DLD7_9BURK|nr:hypothetical protein [Paucibacter sp. R3-3]MDY0746551.1 hypothetical protein [Paucibacter sp. R3-3]
MQFTKIIQYFRGRAMKLVAAGLLSAGAGAAQAYYYSYVETPAGLWILNLTTANVDFCSNTKASTTGAPTGRCAKIGNVVFLSGTYSLKAVGDELMVLYADTGDWWLCTQITNATTSVPAGNCTKVSTAATLP